MGSPLTSVSPALSLSAGDSSGSQPLEPHWIAAASPDHQSPSCWTAPVHRETVSSPMFTVSSCFMVDYKLTCCLSCLSCCCASASSLSLARTNCSSLLIVSPCITHTHVHSCISIKMYTYMYTTHLLSCTCTQLTCCLSCCCASASSLSLACISSVTCSQERDTHYTHAHL